MPQVERGVLILLTIITPSYIKVLTQKIATLVLTNAFRQCLKQVLKSSALRASDFNTCFSHCLQEFVKTSVEIILR